ncbi:MAG: hypothetical protein R3C44_10850 [Chloroflexota bacterium]
MLDLHTPPVSGSDQLYEGDVLQQVGDISWEMYRTDQTQPLFENASPGESVTIQVLRDGEEQTVNWIIPGVNTTELLFRLVDIWWLPYFFWLAGLGTVLVIRPVDIRRTLLIAFFYLTALWLILGTTGSSHLWYSATLFRASIWLTIPIYLHLHWVFPAQLAKVSSKVWWPIYGGAILLALAELGQLLPPNLYPIGLLIALGGSLVLLIAHFVLRKSQRRDIGILLVLVLFAFLPTLILLGFWVTDTPLPITALGFIALLGLPGGYFYVAYRGQPGWPQLRVNRLVSLYLFLMLVFVIAVVVTPLVAHTGLDSASVPIAILIALATALVTSVGYPPFSRFIERQLLDMPYTPEQLVALYATRITTRLSTADLVDLLRNEVLPTLQVRQSAMLQLQPDGRTRTIYRQGLPDVELPDSNLIGQLLTGNDAVTDAPSWLKFRLPLKLDGEPIGIWLFGRRDPDDAYPEGIVRLLEVLSHQTSIALANISKTEQLQKLYEVSIQRQEEERISLARELHDDTLNDLAAIGMYRSDPAQFMRIHERLVDRIRLIIRGLRPAMLEYGLWRGLADLVQDLQDRGQSGVEVVLRVPESDSRYPERVEQQLYRITQQAVENALEHARPTIVSIDGFLHEGAAHLIIKDDGIGMPNPQQLDLGGLLENHHYGLVGMFERASLINAEMHISSEPGVYTSMEVNWTAPEISRENDTALTEIEEQNLAQV